jgi:hypothetical protein
MPRRATKRPTATSRHSLSVLPFYATSLQYLPNQDAVPSANNEDDRAKHRNAEAFAHFICTLPPQPIIHPVDHGWHGLANGSVGKAYWTWLRALYIGTSRSQRRRTLDPALLQTWRWRPRSIKGECGAPSSWLMTDVCGHSAARGSAAEIVSIERWLADAASGGPDSPVGLLWAAQLTRLLLSSTLGACGVQARDTLLRRAQTSPPLPTLGTGASIAVHIRRGDSCMRWATRVGDAAGASTKTGVRPCYPLAMYLRACRRLRSLYNATRLLVATDSPSVISELVATRAVHGFEVSYLPFDRGAAFGVEEINIGRSSATGAQQFIENRRGTDNELVLASCAADLAHTSGATAFVGTAASVMSRLMFLNIVGHRGSVPPSMWLDRPFGHSFSHPAPLELP